MMFRNEQPRDILEAVTLIVAHQEAIESSEEEDQQTFGNLEPQSLPQEEEQPDPSHVMCDICCESYAPSFFFHLPGCSHSYCKNCMSDHLKTKITDGQVFKIKCMDLEC
jgi:hypothetical protein